MQTVKHRLKEHVWLLTALACFLLVLAFPAGRETAGHHLRHDWAGAWRNAVSMLRSVEYGPPRVNTRQRLNDLLRLAERTHQPRIGWWWRRKLLWTSMNRIPLFRTHAPPITRKASAERCLTCNALLTSRLRDKGNTVIHALVGIAIQAITAKAAGPFTSNEMGLEMRKSAMLRGKINEGCA